MPALLAATALGLVACGPVLAGGEPELILPRPVVHAIDLPAVRLVDAFGGERFQRPVDAQQAPGDARTWYVVEQRGLIFRLIPGVVGWVRQPFLDIQERVNRTHNEEGLLGLAFSPHFAEEGHPHRGVFYVNYSVKPGQASRLSRFRVAPGSAASDPASEEILMEIPQPYRNHNGGGLLFGPDGQLYYGLGDGGSAGDPAGRAQDLGEVLGSILRLDVSPGTEAYRIPPDNPFVERAGAAPEIWAYGLRNPWRFSFDRKTGECWVGDVGQNLFEWVVVAERGKNHGWDLLEGFHRFELPQGAGPPADLVPPLFEYAHGPGDGEGLSITGGFVYRGRAIPELDGFYLFADYVSRDVWAIRRRGDGSVEHGTLLRDAAVVSSFAEGHDGELLVIDHHGPVLRLLRGSAD